MNDQPILEIKDLNAGVEGKQILKGINLSISAGEVHAVMGPNGSGKSTLAAILAGRDGYDVSGGQVLYNGQDLLDMDPEERAREGLFLAFQYPVEIHGVNKLKRPDNAQLVITHYQRLLNYIVPDFVHVLYDGRIVRTGDKQLAMDLEEKGYEWIIKDEAVPA